MTMKRTCALLGLLLWSLSAFPIDKSGTVVYINGAKYYIHTVQPGETLYGLSKAYEVGEKVIVENNPSAASGLRAARTCASPSCRPWRCARRSPSASCARRSARTR